MSESRYVRVHRSIWPSPAFLSLDKDARFVFLHLTTTPQGNHLGLFRATPEMLAIEPGMSVKAYRAAFERLIEQGMIEYDPEHAVIYLPHFLESNPPANPNVIKGMTRYFEELPDCELKAKLYEQLKQLAEGFGEPFAEWFTERFAKPFENDLGNGYRKPAYTSNLSLSSSLKKGRGGADQEEQKRLAEAFEIFYSAYPKKRAREDAEKAWKSLKPDSMLVETIMLALAAQAVSEDWVKEAGKFVPHPASWIRGKRWEDTIESRYTMEDLPKLQARITEAQKHKVYWQKQVQQFGESADNREKLREAEAAIAQLGPEIERLESVK